eukprot:TRINITY_DN96327_c0_g1_i1.p1 TRINITY_DN96327_c0_g1~~TRINITY_DN96327_c0_g1_i1.p1  ORF type:complete len:328 (+),score=48.56 TRINITY_DN96327_c0_g1_i1:94-1077(+)
MLQSEEVTPTDGPDDGAWRPPAKFAVNVKNVSGRALACKLHYAVDMPIHFDAFKKKTPVPIRTEDKTLDTEETVIFQDGDTGPEGGNCVLIEVLDEQGENIVETYGRLHLPMRFLQSIEGEYKKGLVQTPWDQETCERPAYRNLTPCKLRCRVYEGQDPVEVSVLPWQGFVEGPLTKIEVLNGEEVAETWMMDEDECQLKKQGEEDGGTMQFPADGTVSVLQPQGSPPYNLHLKGTGKYSVTVAGDKGKSHRSAVGQYDKPINFTKDDFNWVGKMDDIYDNLASPGTKIRVEVSSDEGTDVYEIQLEDGLTTVFSLRMKPCGMRPVS